jgi:hypothetical protein
MPSPIATSSPMKASAMGRLLRSVALARVKRGKKEHAQSEGKKDDVEHRASPGVWPEDRDPRIKFPFRLRLLGIRKA